MTTDAKPRLKITYATLRNDNEELHALYDAGISQSRSRLGAHHLNLIGGKERQGDGETTVRSPIDHEVVIGHFAKGTRQDVRDAIGAARAPTRAAADRLRADLQRQLLALSSVTPPEAGAPDRTGGRLP